MKLTHGHKLPDVGPTLPIPCTSPVFLIKAQPIITTLLKLKKTQISIYYGDRLRRHSQDSNDPLNVVT